MKSLNMILMSLMVMALSACGGSGGGGGGGGTPGTPTGSATFTGLSSGSGGSQCVKDGSMVTLASYFTTQVSCEGAGGTWASHSVTTPDVCRVNGRDFSLRNASPAIQAETDACGAAGGTYIPSSTNTVNYCDVSAVTCGDVGGTSYSVNTLSGSFVSQNIVAGTNRVAADPTEVATTLGLFNGVFDLDNTNLNLVSMTATFTIDHKWDASVVMSPSVYNLMSSAVELNVSSPAATNSYISVESSSVVLYYH